MIDQLARAFRTGEQTPSTALAGCLAALESREADVRAWVSVAQSAAQAQAERCTQELAQGQVRGPLHGIAVGIKDVVDVFDWPTAAGSRRWAGAVARHDAPVVARLRQAGAVFVGKTVTTAYASFDPPITRNPHDLARTPGGSSSGSAAAVACGMCVAALATQTGGSTIRPAAYCGVPGFKPTFAAISTRGVVPLAPSLDHIGIIAQSVPDLAIVFRGLRTPRPSVPQVPITQARWLDVFAERIEPELAAALQVDERVQQLEPTSAPSGFADVLHCHRLVMAIEAAAYHEPRLRADPSDYPPNITALLHEGLRCAALEHERCRQHRRQLRADVARALRPGMVWITPAATGPAPLATTTGDPAFNSPWSYLGLPTVSVPFAHTSTGLPLALQFTAAAGQDEALLAYAATWERP